MDKNDGKGKEKSLGIIRLTAQAEGIRVRNKLRNRLAPFAPRRRASGRKRRGKQGDEEDFAARPEGPSSPT